MAHPFFGASIYPLHLPVARKLRRQLSMHISSHTHVDMLLRSCDPGLTRIQPADPEIMWLSALDKIAAGMRLREFIALLKEENIRALDEVITEVENATALQPRDQELVDCVPIFLNRRKLHRAVRLLGSADSKFRVLLVRGDEQGGKSWTRHVVAAHARTLGHSCTYLCQGLIGTVDEALETIFAGFGKPPPPRDTSGDAWLAKVCREMMRCSVEVRAAPHWIIVDDLGLRRGQPLLDERIRDFFDQMVLHMQNPQFALSFRLVLLNYPEGALPTRWERCWIEDRVAADEIRTAEITEYLLRWAQEFSRNLPHEQAELLAAKVLANAEQGALDPGKSRLGCIHDELHTLLETMEAGA